ncbi:hypothetical protein AB0H57_14305 [Micromonospora sp. NPDC050686]|uniref:hypothetical protein n=1 Tax=Micromonospora sp. NPDC050686 TaxID=3154631 RepID=UPI0033DCB989
MSGDGKRRWTPDRSVPRSMVALRYGLIAAILPYLVLKVLWVAGVMVGVPDSSPAHDGWQGANLATLALDVVAVGLALAFTQRWGRRLPAWSVLVPAWIGTGFLTPAAVQVPVGFVYSLLTTGQPVRMTDGLVEDWTYTVVYSSFALQGVLLAAAFAGYARSRWGDRYRSAADGEPRSTHGVSMVLAVTGAALAAVVAGLRLSAALGTPDDWRADGWPALVRLGAGVEGLLACCAGAGILALAATSRTGRRLRPGIAVPLAFVGSGTMTAYGLLRTMAALAALPLSDLTGPVPRLTEFTAVLAGVVVGITGSYLLAEGHARAGVFPT